MIRRTGSYSELIKNKQYKPIFMLPITHEPEDWYPVLDRAISGVAPGYFVSSRGYIYSVVGGEGYLSLVPDDNGYFKCDFYLRKGGKKTVRIHRVVMLTYNYYPGCEDMQVNHKDGIKTNNWIGNLEWVTARENMQHAHATGLIKSKYNNR